MINHATSTFCVSSTHTQGEYKAQKEAVWAVTNMAAGGNTDQIAYIVQAGCLKPLCDLLVVKETKIVSVILEAVTNILHVSGCVCMLYEQKYTSCMSPVCTQTTLSYQG